MNDLLKELIDGLIIIVPPLVGFVGGWELGKYFKISVIATSLVCGIASCIVSFLLMYYLRVKKKIL